MTCWPSRSSPGPDVSTSPPPARSPATTGPPSRWPDGDATTDRGDDALEVIAVPGTAALEMVERHVDYAGLPATQREMLQDLRAKLDAGQVGGERPDRKDLVGLALARVVGVGEFDGRLA